MFTISKRFDFSASHQLVGLPEDHPCSHLHGHNYIVEAVLEGEHLNMVGFVFDYRELAPFKALIDSTLDHRHLNDVLPSTTAERLATWLYRQLDDLLSDKTTNPEAHRYWHSDRSGPPGTADSQWFRLAAIRVSETPKTWAEYRP